MVFNLSWDIIRDYEKRGLITVKPDESHSLFILNYTNYSKIKNMWDFVTLHCRGLIVDINGNVKYQCLPKFFNLEEHSSNINFPYHLDYEIQEKYDGSYGVLYFNKTTNDYAIATRGSFNSEQAIRATVILHKKYGEYIKQLDTYNYTFIFEIIYPENQIVVDYGNEEKLVLIAVIHNRSGDELSLKNSSIPFPDQVKIYENLNFKDFQELKEKYDSNDREGFVIKFKNGFRVKVKFDTYFYLHRIVSTLSKRSIWEVLNENNNDEILDKINKIHEIKSNIPTSYINFVEKTASELIFEFQRIKTEVFQQYISCPIFKTRKDFALWAKDEKHSKFLFALYDNKEIDDLIWKEIKP